MPGLNGFSSRTGAILDELIRDEAHKAAFDGFIAETLVGDAYVSELDDIRALVDIVPIEYGDIPVDDGVRTALVAHDSPTPKGNSKIEQMPVLCNEYRFAQPLTQMSRSSTRQLYRDLEELMRTKSGLQVKLSVEKEFLSILRAQGSSATYTGSTNTVVAAAAQWNNYTGLSHDPIKDISDKMILTGATKFFIGRDVAQALKGSPKFTGASAGSGTEFLTDDELIEKLIGLGFTDVWIAGKTFVNGRSPNLPASLSRLHNGIAAMWAPGGIRMFKFEDFQYDEYSSDDDRKDYYRALQTSVFKAPYAESVGTFTNILA